MNCRQQSCKDLLKQQHVNELYQESPAPLFYVVWKRHSVLPVPNLGLFLYMTN